MHFNLMPNDYYIFFPSWFYIAYPIAYMVHILYFTSTCKLKLALARMGSLEIKSQLDQILCEHQKTLFPLRSADHLLRHTLRHSTYSIHSIHLLKRDFES